MDLLPACNTYLPNHWKNGRAEFPAAQFWELIGAETFVARVVAELRRCKVSSWVPSEWTEQLLGSLIELCLYASPDDLSVGHEDLDIALGTWWDSAPSPGAPPAARPKRVVKIDLGIADQSENRPLLNGSLWAQPRGEWFWEEKEPEALAFWVQARWAQRFEEDASWRS